MGTHGLRGRRDPDMPPTPPRLASTKTQKHAPLTLPEAENQITTSKQTAFYDRILKTHRTTPSKVALFASG